MLARETKARIAVLSFCLFPLLSRDASVLNEEALNELGRHAKRILHIDGKIEWRESFSEKNTIHPCWSACLHTINKLPMLNANRKTRARQLFLYLLTENVNIPEPDLLEEELNNCFNSVKKYAEHLIK